MLKKIISRGLTSYHEGFSDWKEAVRVSYQKMLEKGIVNEAYIDEVISSIIEFGPYIVIAPHVAMPHSTTGSNNAYDTAFSFMRVKNPVVFDENDVSKNAKVFFSFAAVEEDAHLKNIVSLVELLVNEDFVAELFEVDNDEQLLNLIEKYEIE